MYKEELLLKFYNFMKKHNFTLLSLNYLDYDSDKKIVFNKNKNEEIKITDDEFKTFNSIDRNYISKNELYNFYHIQENKKRKNSKSSPVTNNSI